MNGPLSNDEILERIEQAFAPHECTAAYTDEGQRFDFEITDAHGDVIASMSGVILSSVREPAALDIVISYMRDKVDEAGKRSA